MGPARLTLDTPVTLVGGGDLDAAMLAAARQIAPALVAADSGADRLLALGVARHEVDAIIGDMDSIADLAPWREGPTRILHLEEQDTTDFEKCLYATEAPLYVAAGFTGRRVDHMLAVLHSLLGRRDKRVLLLGTDDVVALAPPGQRMELDLEPGARVSIFPLLPVRGAATGLRWPIDGLAFALGQQSGTSNQATEARISLRFDGPGALILLEPRFLTTLATALTAAPVSSPGLPLGG